MDSAHLLLDARVLSLNRGLLPGVRHLKDWPGLLLPGCSVSFTSVQQVFIECSPELSLVPANVDGVLGGEEEGLGRRGDANFEKESGRRLVQAIKACKFHSYGGGGTMGRQRFLEGRGSNRDKYRRVVANSRRSMRSGA